MVALVSGGKSWPAFTNPFGKNALISRFSAPRHAPALENIAAELREMRDAMENISNAPARQIGGV